MTTTNTANLLAPLAFRADAKQRSVKTASAHGGRVLLMLLLALFTATQAAMAETVTYTISGNVEGNVEGNVNVNFSVSASGDAMGSAGTQWSFTGASASGNISVPGGITMSFGSDKTSSMAVSGHLIIQADGDTGGYFTLSHASKYIYHITLKKTGGDVIQEAWNITKSYTYRFKVIELQTIVVDYADAIPITGAVITGLNSQYPVSDTAVTPTPTVTWHGTTLTSGTHYTFSYQNNTAPGTATVKATGTGRFSSGTSVSADYTLVWATYSVSFNKNNAAATGTMANQDFTYSIAQALTANAFSREGYAFAGWSTKANGNVVYADKQEVTNLTATDGATFNLYAQWAPITYTLRLHHNDGTDDYTDMTMTYGQAQSIQSVSRAGFILTGWNTTPDGSGTAYADGQSVQDLTATQGEVIHLYAQWAVTYIAADGTEQTVDDFTILSDATIPINSYNWGAIGTDGQDTWYVATGSYTFAHDRLKAFGHVHLILADGAVFNVDGNMYGIDGRDLTIYGQRQGTGQLNASTSSVSNGQGAICVANLTIYAGTVSTTTVSGDGITASNNVTIHGGTVNANGASGGIDAPMGNITLGWSKASDRITVRRYNAVNGTVSVKDGQTFYDGTDTYSGTLSADDLDALAGKTLRPAVPYIAADGTEQTVNDYTILSDATIPINSDNWGTIGTSGQDTWYVATGSYTFDHDRLKALGHVHLILADGAVFNVDGNMYGISGRDLTIYGQRQGTGQLNASTSDASNGQGAICVANLTIYGGTVSTTTVSGDGITASNNVTIHGGTVNANGASGGIDAHMGNITLGWSKASDRITASSYRAGHGTSVKDGQTFYDGTDSYSGTLSADDLDAIAGKTLQPCLALVDAESNTAAIAAQSGKAIAVALQGRTLYKDGKWNTLCLPFDVTLSGSVLDGNNVQAMTLNTSTSGLSGSTLTLNFTQVSPSGEQGGLIPAGTPFIIKWDGDGSTNITSPVFAGVTIDDTPRDATVEGVVTFTGTYAPFSIGDGGDNTVLYLGAANKLYYPTNAMTIGCQRAYFQLLGGLTAGEPTSPQQNAVSAVALNFFDEEASGIAEVKADADLKSASRESGISNPLQREWYTLDGRRLSGKPAQGGVYVVGGRKVVVK